MAELNDLIYHFSNDGLNINVEIRPLVKCKECKFNFDGLCDSEGVTSNALVEPDWFCADGEVKNNAE